MGVCGLVVGRRHWISVRLSESEREQLDTLVHHFIGSSYFDENSVYRSKLFRELLDLLCPEGRIEVYSKREVNDAFWRGYFEAQPKRYVSVSKVE